MMTRLVQMDRRVTMSGGAQAPLWTPNLFYLKGKEIKLYVIKTRPEAMQTKWIKNKPECFTYSSNTTLLTYFPGQDVSFKCFFHFNTLCFKVGFHVDFNVMLVCSWRFRIFFSFVSVFFFSAFTSIYLQTLLPFQHIFKNTWRLLFAFRRNLLIIKCKTRLSPSHLSGNVHQIFVSHFLFSI